MSQALQTLKMKGVDISDQEEEAALAAILLHDIGHGPFSHALEYYLIETVSHEELSLFLMDKLNREYGELLILPLIYSEVIMSESFFTTWFQVR